jgi:hypothetical protein
MHTVNLIASAIRGKEECPVLPEKTERGICCITGEESECVYRSERIGNAFTNLDLLKSPESRMMGVDAYIALGYKWERMSCWLCDGKEFYRIKRVELRDYVLNGVPFGKWSAYVTTSYKKHGALWTKVNTGSTGIWRFEMNDVDCRDLRKVNVMYNSLNNFLHDGIGRSVLESLDCSPFIIGKIGIIKWMEFDKWARPIFLSPFYQFICYLLPSSEERKNEEPTFISNGEQGSLF